MDLTATLPTFVVTLREGFEAALVVGIVLACLKKAQQTQLNRWVYQGIGGGLVASVMLGLLLGEVLQEVDTYSSPYTPAIKEILSATFGLVAIVMLSWMLLWMTQQAKSIKLEVEGAIATALTDNKGAGRAVFLLVFIAVLREGFETVLFIAAKFQQGWAVPALGALAGSLMAAGIGFLLFQLGIKINVRLFFKIMGIFLILIVGGLVIGVLKHLDTAWLLLAQLNWQYAAWCLGKTDTCFLGSLVWNASDILPEGKFPGIIIKSLFGYRQILYLGQLIAYLLFLIVIGGAYFQSLQNKLFTSEGTKKSTERVVN
jgi:high-affinity iron transporter